MIQTIIRQFSPLQVTILVSVLIHALIIFTSWQSYKTINISTLPQGTAGFEIALTDLRQPEKKSRKATANKQPSQKHITNQAAQTKKTEKVKLQQQKPDKLKQQMQPHEEGSSRLTNNMIRFLEAEFRTRFQYPLVARKRGWQGKVIIAMDISRTGSIDNINIKQSSGFTILDNNAIDTFKAIGSMKGFSQDYSRDYKLNIPVIYKLTKG